MKRIGYLYEQMATVENCTIAEQLMVRNKPKNRMAQYIKANAEKYGAALSEKLTSGTYRFHASRKSVIHDSYKGKTRNLLIPCLEDQAAEQAWLNVAVPHLMRRNYYYNCGSIPGAGQLRATDAIRRWMRKKRYKYGDVTDIRKFYDRLPHETILRGLRRIFKDNRFIAFVKAMLDSMSATGIGLAIGHPISHWLANVALIELDHGVKRLFPDVRYVRYMDDMALISNNRRHLNWAVDSIGTFLARNGMELKIVRRCVLTKCPMQFLSYRFSFRKTVLAKRLMYRISRKMRRAANHLSVHMAAAVLSYNGILMHCDSHNFIEKYVTPIININQCRRIISHADKSAIRHAA